LRSLDRILSEAWHAEDGLLHVLAYSDAKAERRRVPGVLDDYAFTAVACLDAYETSADLSYLNFARLIAATMVERFFDPVSGGFFDTGKTPPEQKVLGVLGTRRKPFQDSPTPAGNSVAAIALLRLYAYTNDPGLRDKAEQTIELVAGLAAQYGIFAATYGIAAVHLSQPHVQIVVVGNDELADRLHAAAVALYSAGKVVLWLAVNQAVPRNLPPALAVTIPELPALKLGKGVAVICSGFTCQPPISDPEELTRSLHRLFAAKI
jgi:uncharacterized protein YyaL (SSP411 family)